MLRVYGLCVCLCVCARMCVRMGSYMCAHDLLLNSEGRAGEWDVEKLFVCAQAHQQCVCMSK